MFGDDRVRPYAYTYRDYVIRAFNEDLGFDRFIHEQLAADAVAPKDQPWRLAAMGFLTLGRGFDNNLHDQIDDRIDTVTRGLLGLTVSCGGVTTTSTTRFPPPTIIPCTGFSPAARPRSSCR